MCKIYIIVKHVYNNKFPGRLNTMFDSQVSYKIIYNRTVAPAG